MANCLLQDCDTSPRSQTTASLTSDPKHLPPSLGRSTENVRFSGKHQVKIFNPCPAISKVTMILAALPKSTAHYSILASNC